MIICLCHKVSDRDIARQVAGGCRDFDTLQEQTSVATACGACTDCALDLMHEHLDSHTARRVGEHSKEPRRMSLGPLSPPPEQHAFAPA